MAHIEQYRPEKFRLREKRQVGGTWRNFTIANLGPYPGVAIALEQIPLDIEMLEECIAEFDEKLADPRYVDHGRRVRIAKIDTKIDILARQEQLAKLREFLETNPSARGLTHASDRNPPRIEEEARAIGSTASA